MRGCRPSGAKGGRGCRGVVGRGDGRAIQDVKTINSNLCKYASCGDMQGLLDYVMACSQHMNYVNIATAMHKLAHLAKEANAVLHLGDRRLATLHDRAQMALVLQLREAAMPGAGVVMPRCWSTLAWAYATLHLPGLDLQPTFDRIAGLSAPHLGAFKAVELANLLWAFAKSRVRGGDFFHAACRHAEANLALFSRSHLSVIVWALATSRQHQAGLLCKLAGDFAQRAGAEQVDSVGISNLMWGLATTGVRPKPHVFRQIGHDAAGLLTAFRPQELSITAWAFSRLGARHDELFAAVAQRICQEPTLRERVHGQGLANLLWAFNCQRRLGSGVGAPLLAAMQTLLPQCTRLLDQLKALELSCICMALQESGLCRGTCREATAFWDKAAVKMAGAPAMHEDFEDFWPRSSERELGAGIFESASTTVGGSPCASSDAEDEDGDQLGALGGDAHGGGGLGGAGVFRVVDHRKDAMCRKDMPMKIGINAMAAPAVHDTKHKDEVQFPAKQMCPKPKFQYEAMCASDTSVTNGDKITMPDEPECDKHTLCFLPPQRQQNDGSENVQVGRSSESQVCFIVKNTFLEVEADGRKAPESLYSSEPPPLPVRKDCLAGRTLPTFPKLVQRRRPEPFSHEVVSF